MIKDKTTTFQDVRQASTGILDAAIAANTAAHHARERANELHAKKAIFENAWRQHQDMFSALNEEGHTTKARELLHAIIEDLAAAEHLNQGTTENARKTITIILESDTKARREKATADVALIVLKQHTSG